MCFSASVLKKEQRAIHMLVCDTIKKRNLIISGVYAPAQPQDKDNFWQQLVQMNNLVDLPWCIIGDLNELATPSEKKGGICYPPSKYSRLNNFMDNIHARSVPFTGCPFTWKKRSLAHIIYGRLDRAIIRDDWLNLYPDSIVQHGSFLCSDHSPIIFSAANPIRRRKKLPF